MRENREMSAFERNEVSGSIIVSTEEGNRITEEKYNEEDDIVYRNCKFSQMLINLI